MRRFPRADMLLFLIHLAILAGLLCTGCEKTSQYFYSHEDGGPGGGGLDAGLDGGSDKGEDGGTPVLSHIWVRPAEHLVQVDVGASRSIPYSAEGRFDDGVERDVTDAVVWTSSNPSLGAFKGSSFEITPKFDTGASSSVVAATAGGVEGRAQLTVVYYRMSGEKTDFFFALPHNDPVGEQAKSLGFATDVKSLDVFFDMDTTLSMTEEIQNLQSALVGTIIPEVMEQIPDAWFGAGSFEDFPFAPYGDIADGVNCIYNDQPFRLFQTMTSDGALVKAGVDKYLRPDGRPIGCGQDLPESWIESLYQIATGEGLIGPGVTSVSANHEGVGGVGFRGDSMPVIIPITDAQAHTVGEHGAEPDYGGEVAAAAHTRQQAKDALGRICARVVGIGGDPGLSDLRDFATATGARVPPAAWNGTRPEGCGEGQCCTGLNGEGQGPDPFGYCPLVFRIDDFGTGLSSHIVTGLKMLARFAIFDVVTEVVGETTGMNGEPLPAGKTTGDFIKNVEPIAYSLPADPPGLPTPAMTGTEFVNVTPGTRLSFDVIAYNDLVQPTDQPQFFRAVIRVLAGGCTPLDEREVFILVPPEPLEVQ